MNVQPTHLEIENESHLVITWSDGAVHQLAVSQLRDICPCATCREKRNAPPPPPTQLPVLSKSETTPLRIAEMKPVGNYAYSIHFSDGHDTGLFTLNFLREAGESTKDLA